MDGAADGAEPVAGLGERPRHHLARLVAGLALGEAHLEGELEVDQPVALVVADLVALGADRELGRLGALAGDQVDVDRAAAGERREQQLDRGEVGVVAGPDRQLSPARG